MNNKVVCAILVFLLVSCVNDNKKYPITKEVYKKGIRMTITYLNDSTHTQIQYHDNGNPSLFITRKHKNINDGECVFFYPSGIVELKGNYKDGIKDGLWYYYSENGHLKRIAEYIEEFVNRDVYFTKDMQIDTIIEKENMYFTIQPIQDTIYFGEPYILNIRLHTPLSQDGMDIVLVDDISYYINFEEKYKDFKNSIKCSGYGHTLVIQDYHIGNNEVKGIIIDHCYKENIMVPYYFSQSFYVKESPIKTQ